MILEHRPFRGDARERVVAVRSDRAGRRKMNTLARCVLTAVLAAPALALAAAVASADTAASATAETAETPRPAPAIFSGDYKDTLARDIILDIARSARLNAVLPSNLTAKVSAHFDKMPVREALAYVTSLADADYRIMDRTLTVTSRKVIVNARPAETVVKAPPAGRPAEPKNEDVMAVARRIDREESLVPRSRPRPAEGVSVQTYINIQTSPLSPSSYAGASLPYWPPLARGGFAGRYGGYGGTVWLPSGVAITPLPSPVYVIDKNCCW